MTKARQSVKALNKTAGEIAANATAEKARKAASRKALKEALKDVTANPTEQTEQALVEAVIDHKAQDAANALATAKADAEATGVTLDVMLADMGIDEQGFPVVAPKGKYTGPMLVLRQAAKGYIKTSNGQPCNGDVLALALGSLTREQVVATCIAVLAIPGNPYLHLNPGQQSMNLRNKVRHALKNDLTSIAAIRDEARRQEAIKAA